MLTRPSIHHARCSIPASSLFGCCLHRLGAGLSVSLTKHICERQHIHEHHDAVNSLSKRCNFGVSRACSCDAIRSDAVHSVFLLLRTGHPYASTYVNPYVNADVMTNFWAASDVTIGLLLVVDLLKCEAFRFRSLRDQSSALMHLYAAE